MRTSSTLPAAIAALSIALATACSIKKIAVNKLGDAIAGTGSSFASDDDPELIREATPFGLKTMESLLAESPRHRGLLLAAASGFTQYGYAYIQQDADFVEDEDYDRAVELRERARKLYLRALKYGFRGLEVDFPGFRERLRADPEAVLARMHKKHVGLLYWTANAWGAAMSIAKDDSELTADQHLAEALARRALALDEAYDHGSIHDFFISYEGGRRSVGGSVEKARHHLERAIALGGGHRAWPLVNFAETVSVGLQEREEFNQLLEQALAVDVDVVPDLRLTNLIAQKRARWLLGRTDDLFIE
jgi:predicted anti-sigma-YlaC factor YlaD